MINAVSSAPPAAGLPPAQATGNQAPAEPAAVAPTAPDMPPAIQSVHPTQAASFGGPPAGAFAAADAPAAAPPPPAAKPKPPVFDFTPPPPEDTKPPMPVAPSEPDFNFDAPPPPPAGGDDSGNSTSGNSPEPTQPPKKKRLLSPKMIVGGILLFLLVAGSGAGLYLSQRSQDVRQQASISCADMSENDCKAAATNGCTWNEGQEVRCNSLNLQQCKEYEGCEIRDFPLLGQSCQGQYSPPNAEPGVTLDCSNLSLDQCAQFPGCSVVSVQACQGTHNAPGSCSGQYRENDGGSGTAPQPGAGTTTTPGCDNGVPIGGTACQTQGDNKQYRCGPGSFTPGGNNWISENCSSGQTCQGNACSSGGTSCAANCTLGCPGLYCEASCQSGSSCQIYRKTFVCQGNSDSACGDSHQSFISELSKSDDASVDPSDSRYWCKTVQIDVHAGSSPSDHQTTNASVIWIGDNGSYCIEDKYCMINGNRVDYVKDIQDTALDWDCSPPAALSCNSTCTSDTQCSAVNPNYGCFPSFNFPTENFEDITGNFIGLGSGNFSSVSTWYTSGGQPRQYLVRGGRIFRRTSFSQSDWTDITAQQNIPGSGDITSFSAYRDKNGQIHQYAVRGGQIYYRAGESGSWQNQTNNFANVGSGTITSFSAMQMGSNVDQRLVRGGSVWNRPNTNTNTWQNVTGWLLNGTGPVVGYSQVITPEGELKQYYVRENKTWHRSALSDGNRCRLNTSPGSTSCVPAVPPPPTQELQCNSVCNNNTPNDMCPGDLACLNGRCRLPSNPSSSTCQEPAPVVCNSPCSVNPGADVCKSLGTDYSCVQVSGGSFCRRTSNPSDASCKEKIAPMCGQISMSTTDPKPGDQVTFTCSAASGSSADLTNISYNFRVVEPDENEVLLTAQGNRSSIYTIPTGKYGTFVAECSLTDSSGNTPWPGQCEEHSQCQGISCASGAEAYCSGGQCVCPPVPPTTPPTTPNDPTPLPSPTVELGGACTDGYQCKPTASCALGVLCTNNTCVCASGGSPNSPTPTPTPTPPTPTPTPPITCNQHSDCTQRMTCQQLNPNEPAPAPYCAGGVCTCGN